VIVPAGRGSFRPARPGPFHVGGSRSLDVVPVSDLPPEVGHRGTFTAEALMLPGLEVVDFIDAMLARPEWHRWAACRGIGTSDYFPVRSVALAIASTWCLNGPNGAPPIRRSGIPLWRLEAKGHQTR